MKNRNRTPKIALRTIVGMIMMFISFQTSYGQSKVEKLDDLINQYLEYGKFNGSVLVAHEGEVLLKKGYGWANMEWDIPNAPNTKHRLGSITKQFTAMLILQLAAEGKLDLQAPISTYLPYYPKEKGDKITTHHLLTHSSGIPNYTSFPGFFEEESRNPYTPEEFIKKFQDKELDFAPGSQYSYSNSGYFLLGVLIEKLSGKSYEEMLHDKILTTLGMNDTGFDHHEDILKNRATGYEKTGNAFINSNYLDMSIPYAAGSLYSTVEDLYTWDQALYTNTLLSKEYMELYFKPHMPVSGNYHYAYGWGVGKSPIGNTKDSIVIISHGGGINGFNTNIARSTADKSLVILLNNTGGAPLNDMTRAIWGIVYGKSYDLPKKSLAYDVLSIIKSEGIEAGLDHFNKNKNSDSFDLRENEMNHVGYQLLEMDKIQEAAKIFELNKNTYPNSANVYDSYAEALMKLGNKEEAIKNYKKSVEMNPANQNGIDMLKELGVDTTDLVKEVTVPDEILETYIGKYALSPQFIITISKEGNQMKAQATGQPMFDIFPKSNNVFYLKVVEAQLTFNSDENGKIESLTLKQGGQETTGSKLSE